MTTLTSEQSIKKAFRIAYDYMMKHNHVFHTAEEYIPIVDELEEISKACNRDTLTERLILAVYDFICVQSKEIIDAEGKE